MRQRDRVYRRWWGQYGLPAAEHCTSNTHTWVDSFDRARFQNGSPTSFRFQDMVIQNTARGIWAGWRSSAPGLPPGNTMDSEGYVLRTAFHNIGTHWSQLPGMVPHSHLAAVLLISQNNMNWDIQDSVCDNSDTCVAGDENGAVSFNVWNSVFAKNRFADIHTCAHAAFFLRGNYSTGSKNFVSSAGRFADGSTHEGEQVESGMGERTLTIIDNTILDPVDTAIDVRTNLETIILDNRIRTTVAPAITFPRRMGGLVNATQPYIGDDMLIAGNQFSSPQFDPGSTADSNNWWLAWGYEVVDEAALIPNGANYYVAFDNVTAPLGALIAPNPQATPKYQNRPYHEFAEFGSFAALQSWLNKVGSATQVYFRQFGSAAAYYGDAITDTWSSDLVVSGLDAVRVRIDHAAIGQANRGVVVIGGGKPLSAGVSIVGGGLYGTFETSYRVDQRGKLVVQAVEAEQTYGIDLSGGSGSFTMGGARYLVHPFTLSPTAGQPLSPVYQKWLDAYPTSARVNADGFAGSLTLFNMVTGLALSQHTVALPHGQTSRTFLFGLDYGNTVDSDWVAQNGNAPVPGPVGPFPTGAPDPRPTIFDAQLPLSDCSPAYSVALPASSGALVLNSRAIANVPLVFPGSNTPTPYQMPLQCSSGSAGKAPPLGDAAGVAAFINASLADLRAAKVTSPRPTCFPHNTDVYLDNVFASSLLSVEGLVQVRKVTAANND